MTRSWCSMRARPVTVTGKNQVSNPTALPFNSEDVKQKLS